MAIARLERTLARDAEPSAALLRQLTRSWGNEAWSASAQFLTVMLQCMPQTTGPIVECGSGLSTLLLAAAAAASGRIVISLEHDPNWAARTLQAVPKHLQPHATVSVTPLRRYDGFDWYGIEPASIPSPVGFVVCDGPPGGTRGGRYGLGPLLGARLAEGCIVLLDDTQRPGEHRIIERWCDELGASIIRETSTCTAIRVGQRTNVSPARSTK
jgi:hypothetical protein